MKPQELCLQATYAPHNKCFGCGQANEQGLRIQSYPEGDKVIADWMPHAFHEAFPGILNGGIIGTLLDCHSNWSAAYFLMQQAKAESPPCTVTSYFNVSLKRPTPSDTPVHLVATLKEIKDLLELYTSDSKCGQVRNVAITKLNQVKDKIRELKKIESTLNQLIIDCNHNINNNLCPLLDNLQQPTITRKKQHANKKNSQPH